MPEAKILTSQMTPGQSISITQTKEFTYIRSLGKGGTGSTHLFHDKQLNIDCVIKKYDPLPSNNREECYARFEQEAAILSAVSHPHIVRLYDCFLYPQQLCGYLQMEYINGLEIDQFVPSDSTKNWNDIFCDAIDAFVAMEKQNILHRDVRASNFLITPDGELKIIDFGFGKLWQSAKSLEDNSVLLNWPGTKPDEVLEHDYSYSTEIYYVGKLFEKVINNNPEFKFSATLRKMILPNQDERIGSFHDVTGEIANTSFSVSKFTYSEKRIYQEFAHFLTESIFKFASTPSYITDVNEILRGMADVIEACALEDMLQDSAMLIRCFVKSGYTYRVNRLIPTEVIQSFYTFLNGADPQQQNTIIKNLTVRLDQIKRDIPAAYDGGDIPF